MPRKSTLKIGAPTGAKKKIARQVKVNMNKKGGFKLAVPSIKNILMGPIGSMVAGKMLNAVKKRFGLGLKRAGEGLLRAGEKRKGGKIHTRK